MCILHRSTDHSALDTKIMRHVDESVLSMSAHYMWLREMQRTLFMRIGER